MVTCETAMSARIYLFLFKETLDTNKEVDVSCECVYSALRHLSIMINSSEATECLEVVVEDLPLGTNKSRRPRLSIYLQNV